LFNAVPLKEWLMMALPRLLNLSLRFTLDLDLFLQLV
jgi:hypothetical protein